MWQYATTGSQKKQKNSKEAQGNKTLVVNNAIYLEELTCSQIDQGKREGAISLQKESVAYYLGASQGTSISFSGTWVTCDYKHFLTIASDIQHALLFPHSSSFPALVPSLLRIK